MGLNCLLSQDIYEYVDSSQIFIVPAITISFGQEIISNIWQIAGNEINKNHLHNNLETVSILSSNYDSLLKYGFRVNNQKNKFSSYKVSDIYTLVDS